MSEHTRSFDSSSRVGLDKQTPETSLGSEIHHQSTLLIDTHAGGI